MFEPAFCAPQFNFGVGCRFGGSGNSGGVVMMEGQQLITRTGNFFLNRYPPTTDRSLRAWDAADEYLLEHIAEHERQFERVLLVNDTFGALTCALTRAFTCVRSHCKIYHWSDSILSQLAVAANVKRNQLDCTPTFINSTESPQGEYDLVLIKVPKTTALLEDQLIRLRRHLRKDSVVVAADMVRNLNRSSFECFEKILGPVTTSLARKKARLIFATLDSTLEPPENPYPRVFNDPLPGFPLFGHANVFSRQRLDLGARYFLDHFSLLPKADSVVDLGCGNGVLGIAYQREFPEAQLHFIDESYMAVESARTGYQHLFGASAGQSDSLGSKQANFLVNDGLSGFADQSVDLILCNPPFHQQHAVAENTAHAWFAESRRCLSQEGELWVVANRHLRYYASLKRLFGACSTVSPGARFNLYRAHRS